MLRFVFILFAVTYFFVRTSFAGEAMIYGIHEQYTSTRSMGMGDAQVAVANDENTMFFNPAGLPQLTESKFNMFVRAGLSPDIKNFANQISDDKSDTTKISNTLQSHYGDAYSLRGPTVGAIYATPKWSIGFIPADVSVDAAVHRATGPAINLRAYQDSTLAFARAWNLHNVRYGTLDVGVTAKLIYRANLDKIISVATIQNSKVINKSDAKEGMTADMDIGAMWHLPQYSSGFFHYAKPTLGVVVRNVLDYGYFSNFNLYSKGSNSAPEKLHRVVDLGSAFKLPAWSVWTSTFAFDVRDIGDPNWTPRKGFHAGLEFLWKVRSWWQGGWRAGINQGYWTAGFTGKIWALKLDLATYGQEVGTASELKQDRVYMFTTSIDF